MTPKLWVHSFAVTETMTHKRGYTIYKITSIVFPRSVPQALTCISVWKRFHDIKRLHRDLCRRQKSLQLNTQIPEPIDCSYFKRFDEGVIHNRKKYILELLDFVAQHPALYKCHSFIEFFSDGHSPGSSPLHDIMCETEKSAILDICDSLDLSFDQQQINLLDPKRPPLNETETENNTAIVATADDATESLVNSFNEVFTEDTKQKPIVSNDFTRFLTPMASIESDDSDYIYEAALEFSKAVQSEVNLDYKEAHEKYKKGVEILLNGSKDDDNDERTFIAKTKISKYSARAKDIYEKFLKKCDEIHETNFQLSLDLTNVSSPQCASLCLERPWNHLSKYKVLRILGDRVMQVESFTEPLRPNYIMKGIEKPSSNSPARSVFLPQGVPYMVELVAFFQSEQKIFLLLKQAEGGRLYDYVLSYKPLSSRNPNLNEIFPEVEDAEASDSSNLSVQDSGFLDDSPVSPATLTSRTDISELVHCSQQLLKSVSNTLKDTALKKCSDTAQSKIPKTDESNTDDQSEEIIMLPEDCLKQWASELAVAIHGLHSKGIILGDLHMDNVLLGSKGQLLLSYFYQNEGLNADYHLHKAFSTEALDGHYIAPERPLTTKSDWWSYGIVLYHLLLGVSFKQTHPGYIDFYGCVQYPDRATISENARDLLNNLIEKTPEERFSYEGIQRHPFFKGTDWGDVLRKGAA